jgi:hypothetical protein
MLKTFILAAAAVATVGVTVPAEAQRYARWETIGSLRVNNRVERDEIRVRGQDRYRAIRLCASGRKDIRILDLDVNYANGGEDDLPNDNSVRAGTCSRAYNLRGENRRIDVVKIAYGKMGVKGRDPVLTVQAR